MTWTTVDVDIGTGKAYTYKCDLPTAVLLQPGDAVIVTANENQLIGSVIEVHAVPQSSKYPTAQMKWIEERL